MGQKFSTGVRINAPVVSCRKKLSHKTELMTSKQKQNLAIAAVAIVIIYFATRKPKAQEQIQATNGSDGKPDLAVAPIVAPLTDVVQPGKEVLITPTKQEAYVKPVVTDWGDFSTPVASGGGGGYNYETLPGQPSYVDGLKTAYATVQSVNMYQ